MSGVFRNGSSDASSGARSSMSPPAEATSARVGVPLARGIYATASMRSSYASSRRRVPQGTRSGSGSPACRCGPQRGARRSVPTPGVATGWQQAPQDSTGLDRARFGRIEPKSAVCPTPPDSTGTSNRSTKPKVTGSNPVGRVLRNAVGCVSRATTCSLRRTRSLSLRLKFRIGLPCLDE